jgi:ATP-dependent RNA helicase DDX46/PRP5
LLTDKEVSEFRKKHGDIKVRGIQYPKPINSWYQCGLPSAVLELLERKKFEKPFPIQC